MIHPHFPRRAVPYLLGAAFITLAFVSFDASDERAEAQSSSRQLHVRLPSKGGTCKLSVGDQVQAVNAFSKMVPVFRHPRCFNCHGNFDITSTDEHSGAGAVPKDLDFRQVLDVPQRLRLHAGCGECHNQITGQANRPTNAGNVIVSGWMMAPAPMQWVKAKDDEQLCMLVKGFEDHPDAFIDHVANDHGEIQFVEAAFKGNRALDAATMDTYDVLTEPPPGSIESVIEDAMRWARLVGNHWKDSDECGCVMPKIKLKVHHNWLFDTPGGVPSKQSSDAQFEVDLEPYGDDRPNYFQGHFSLERRVDMTVPAFCTAKAAVKERWQFYALVDSASGSVKIWHTQISDLPTGEIVCRQGGGTGRMNADPGTLAGVLGAGEMVIPATDSIGRKQANMQGMHETLAITVRARPDN